MFKPLHPLCLPVLHPEMQGREMILVGLPVGDISRGLPQVRENGGKPRGSDIPETGAVHKMLYRAAYIRAGLEEVQYVVDVPHG